MWSHFDVVVVISGSVVWTELGNLVNMLTVDSMYVCVRHEHCVQPKTNNFCQKKNSSVVIDMKEQIWLSDVKFNRHVTLYRHCLYRDFMFIWCHWWYNCGRGFVQNCTAICWSLLFTLMNHMTTVYLVTWSAQMRSHDLYHLSCSLDLYCHYQLVTFVIVRRKFLL